MLAVVALGRAFDEFEEMTQVFAFSGFEFGKLDAHAKGWTALGDNSGKDESFDPDLSIGQPEADFDGYTGRYGCGGLDEASPDAGVGQIPPDRDCGVTQTQLDRDETPHAGVAAAILAPGRSKDVRFEMVDLPPGWWQPAQRAPAAGCGRLRLGCRGGGLRDGDASFPYHL